MRKDRLQHAVPPKREAILAAAQTLFAQKGYEQTTVRDIAQVAGVALGTVYLYFRTKHEVLTSAALDLEATLAQVFRDPVFLRMPFEEVPRAMIEALFRMGREKQAWITFLQLDARSADEILQQKHLNAALTQAIETILRHGIAQGHLAPCNTEMYAQLLHLLGRAVLHQCYAVEGGEREDIYRQQTQEFVERLFFGPSVSEGQRRDVDR